jgi:8-oxo-dGTP pyrophosphatase MutT (NUDIX family)
VRLKLGAIRILEEIVIMGAHSDSNATNEATTGDPPTRALTLADATVLANWLRTQLAPPLMATIPIAPDPPTARIAAVLALLYPRDGVPYLLFTRRSSGLREHRGEISFPGGSHDPADTSLAATALREAWEEIDLAGERVEMLGSLPPLFTVVSNFWVTPVVGWVAGGLPPLTPNPDEVEEIIEAPLSALADPAIFHTETWVRGGTAREVHFYDYGPYRIWGLTGHILSTLLALLPSERQAGALDG